MPAFSVRCLAALLLASVAGAQTKGLLTLDDLFSFVEIRSARLSPDASAAVFVTARPDWKHSRFREDIWLWRNGQDNLLPLAQSGHDSDPRWSPDGKRMAFISDRALEPPAAPDATEKSDKEIGRVWIIDLAGGEAYPLYREPLKVHSFAWSRDGSGIFFSVEEPLSKSAQEAKRRDWKDVERWRKDERGDVLLELAVAQARPNEKPLPVEAEESSEHETGTKSKKQESATEIPKLARVLTRSSFSINEIAPAPVGNQLAFLTNSISGRVEHPAAYEIYVVDASSEGETTARQITHNEALERQLQWSPDGTRLYFGVFAASGSLEGKYEDVQGRLYALNPATGQIERQGKDFAGSWTDYALTPSGKLFGLGQLGTEVQVYSLDGKPAKVSSQPGTYEGIAASDHAAPILFEHSSANEAPELFLGNDPKHLDSAKQITHLNTLFANLDLPIFKTYRWKADDGQSIEGVLLYPPGQSQRKHLRMLTLIHGGPADADGNKFGADWYSWATLAASKGWLVFHPNYRGSTGYGDTFMTAISPHIVSAPGRDILAGVDALIKDGSADAEHLAIGGYSYGGYMTNWLITQTTRFRSAVTGAGAVEHASNWGNDDLTFDDAWYLGGTPWQKPSVYQNEAALFQFEKVKTPVHEVMGADDVRVSASQGYLLERALDTLGIPHQFLIFPGEGHGLGKNPWHGYIKVREELAWLEKYDRAH
jgi:acylaminoacyl-peptidase